MALTRQEMLDLAVLCLGGRREDYFATPSTDLAVRLVSHDRALSVRLLEDNAGVFREHARARKAARDAARRCPICFQQAVWREPPEGASWAGFWGCKNRSCWRKGPGRGERECPEHGLYTGRRCLGCDGGYGYDEDDQWALDPNY